MPDYPLTKIGVGYFVEDTGPAGQPPNTWASVASLNTGRRKIGAASVDAVYTLGGNSSSNTYETSVEKYDSDADSWTTVASLNTGRTLMGVAATQSSVYAVGGETSSAISGTASAEKYDPDADSWTTVASMNNSRRSFAAVGLDGFVYAIGDGSSVEKYDPDADSWTTVASLNTGRAAHAAAVLDGHIYAIGGDDGNNTLTSVEKYDPAADSWTTVAPLNTARENFGATAANGSVYAIGGVLSDGSKTDTVEEYDPVADSWTTIESISTPLGFHAAASLSSDAVFSIGGSSSSADYKTAVERYSASRIYETAYAAEGDAVVIADDDVAKIKNETTGRISNPSFVRDGETIAWQTENQSRLVRTREQ